MTRGRDHVDDYRGGLPADPPPMPRAGLLDPTVVFVTEALPPSVRRRLDDPFAELPGPLAAARRLSFEVVETEQTSASMQRIALTAPELEGFRFDPGQDVMLLVAAEGTRPVRRRYTIRSLD